MTDRDAIRARLAAATPGLWFGTSQNNRRDGVGIVGVKRDGVVAPIAVLAGAHFTIKDRAANTDLIAHAPAVLAALLSDLDRAEAENQRLREALEQIATAGDIDNYDSPEIARAALSAADRPEGTG